MKEYMEKNLRNIKKVMLSHGYPKAESSSIEPRGRGT